MKARLFLVCLLAIGGGARPDGQSDALLFEPVAQPADARPAEPGVLRRQWVTVDLDALRGAAGPRPANAPAPAITLNLFEDVQLRAELVRIEPTASGFVWVGRVPDVDGSAVTFAVSGTATAGSVITPDADYAIRHVGDGVHAVTQVNRAGVPSELPPVVPDIPNAAAADPLPLADDGSTIDLLVVYTPAARVAQGGTGGVEALIDLGVSETNQAYANSGAVQRIRLVHKSEIAYTEAASMSTDLGRLQGTTDGFMDGVHALRNSYAADLVQLIANSPTPCGIAYLLPSPPSTNFAPFAFGVTDDSCVSPNYSFAHEMGHNMGLHHDIYVTGTASGAYPYSRGYVNQFAFLPGAPTSTRWRDIMAYNDQCAAAGFNCARLLYFSNPQNSLGGHPMGEAATADGVRTLNQTRTIVANFRESIPATTMTIDDVSVAERNSGTASVGFRVLLAASTTATVTVNYATVDGSASAGSDYVAASGTLTIPAGTTTGQVTVGVNGDLVAEGTEAFSVQLSNASGAVIADPVAVGTIRNDDFTDLSLSGATIKAVHVIELRTMINEARARRALAPFEFTNTLSPGTTLVRAVDVMELRTALPPDCRPAVFTDPLLAPGVTPIRAVHVSEVRSAIIACP